MFGKRKPKRNISSYFSLSYCSWLTVPRVLLQQMDENWQERFVKLMDEFDSEFPNWQNDSPDIHVMGRVSGKAAKLPDWLHNYRQPDKIKIMLARGDKDEVV